jgi:SAM-dependent methyltransferase
MTTFGADAAVSCLSDDAVLRFAVRYLARRYQGIAPSSFPNTTALVEAILGSLVESGAEATRRAFFEGSQRASFDELYARVQPRRFEFDGQIVVPWLQQLPFEARVLDFGAGNNQFLPAVATCANRHDVSYFASDFFAQRTDLAGAGCVQFLRQPSPTDLPACGPLQLIMLRRTAHHLEELGQVLRSVRSGLAPGGVLLLIEDTFDEADPTVSPALREMVDDELTGRFCRDLSAAQRISFLKFNDLYANYLFHGWTSMPLPLNHKSLAGWVSALDEEGFTLLDWQYLGFPTGSFNLHQAATGVVRFVVS